MSHLNLESKYNTFILTEEEELQAAVLDPLKAMYLRNKLLEVIEQKLTLAPTDLTPAGKESYWQQEAYLRGQFDVIHWLLDSSTAAIEALSNPSEGNS